ncbi:MAG: glycosyltransferase [Candidatus Moranbacteria bacterium]|nr:glycosyltransferase [Candidatus Moranbacteria bacterium]
MLKKAFIIWVQEVKLSEFLAREIDAKIIISCKKYWGRFAIPIIFRYIIQGFDTYRKLRQIRPQIIFVQNPPITAVLVVYFYAKLNSAKYIIDTHTAGFIDRKWIFFHPLHKFLAKRAIWNTAHNYKNLEILKSWGIEKSSVLQFYTPTKKEVLKENVKLSSELEDKLNKRAGLKVFMVNRFAGDDAWQEVAETAKLLPQAIFFLTGNDKKISPSVKSTFPENVILTGYLRHPEFMTLMERSDVILALTKRRDTVLWSIREIMALRKPFVTTDSDAIRHYFSDVALFTNHNPKDMAAKIQLAIKNQAELKEKIELFLEKDAIRWKNDILFIDKIIAND